MKSLEVSEEIQELFGDVVACTQCRDACINSVFKAKRAIYYAKQAERAKTKAWALVTELWPEVRTGNWSYSPETKSITETSNVELSGPQAALSPEGPARTQG